MGVSGISLGVWRNWIAFSFNDTLLTQLERHGKLLQPHVSLVINTMFRQYALQKYSFYTFHDMHEHKTQILKYKRNTILPSSTIYYDIAQPMAFTPRLYHLKIKNFNK